MVLLPRPVESLLRHGCRLFLAAVVLFFALLGLEKSGTNWERSLGGLGSFLGEDNPLAVEPRAHVMLCIPYDQVRAFQNGDPEAVEYEVAVRKQLSWLMEDLNNPRSDIRRRHPGHGFVIVVQKRPKGFTPRDANTGRMSLLVTVPYPWSRAAGEEFCPPLSVRSPDHPDHLPEFVNSTYEREWRSVPTLDD